MPVAMRRRLMAVVVLVLLVASLSAVGCAGGSGPEIALAYTFKAGDTWVQEASTTVSGTTEGIGDVAPADTNATTKTRITTKVESVAADGAATITVTTETLESVQDGEAQDFGSTLPQTVTIVMDTTGKVLSMVGGEDAASGLLDTGSFLNPSDLTGELNNVFFPKDGTAKVGEKWTSTSTLPLTGLDQEIEVTTKAKLVGVATENGAQVATIEYTTTMPMDLDLDLGQLFSSMFGGSDSGSSLDIVFKMTTKGSLELSGTAKVDVTTGQPVSGNANGTMDFSIEVTEAPEMFVPKDQRGPYNSVMTLDMRVTRVE
jgi:hypothetical protein